jgi:SAM-dependent methyltransferase
MKRPDIEFDGQHLPFPDASADHLLCTQVLQFAADPVGFFAELARVLKDDGNLILSAPQSEAMTERPYDRYRFTRDGLTALCLENDLRVLSVRAPLGFWQSFAYDLVCFAAARLYHRGLPGKAALVSVGVVTQTLASALDRFTSYKGNTNSWVIHAARNAR